MDTRPDPAASPAASRHTDAPTHDFAELTLQLAELVLHEMHRFAAQRNLDLVHLRAMVFLSRANQYSNCLSALVDHLGLTKGTVSKSIALLEQHGFIRKEADAQDRRQQHLLLSLQGDMLVDELMHHLRLPDISRQLGAERILGINASLRDVLSTCQRINQRRAFGICRGCRHHQRTPQGGFCGLTQSPLSDVQAMKLCREFSEPDRPLGNDPETTS